MSALVVMLLLGFFLVIAASLTIWAALGLTQHAPAAARPGREPTPESPVVVARPSNDEVRGAHVKVSQHGSTQEDAFERFVRSDGPRGGSDF